MGIQDTKAVLLFFFFVTFCSFCSLFFLSSFKSQLLNDIPVAVAGDRTQNPVEKVYNIFELYIFTLCTKIKTNIIFFSGDLVIVESVKK